MLLALFRHQQNMYCIVEAGFFTFKPEGPQVMPERQRLEDCQKYPDNNLHEQTMSCSYGSL
jgi:hypothetical protein